MHVSRAKDIRDSPRMNKNVLGGANNLLHLRPSKIHWTMKR